MVAHNEFVRYLFYKIWNDFFHKYSLKSCGVMYFFCQSNQDVVLKLSEVS